MKDQPKELTTVDLCQSLPDGNNRGEDALLEAIGNNDEKAIIKIATIALQACRNLRKERDTDRDAFDSINKNTQHLASQLNAYSFELNRVLNRAIMAEMPFKVDEPRVINNLSGRLCVKVKEITEKTKTMETDDDKNEIMRSYNHLVRDWTKKPLKHSKGEVPPWLTRNKPIKEKTVNKTTKKSVKKVAKKKKALTK